MKYKVIYFTGAPAAGKSTLCRELVKSMDTIRFFEYGKQMSKYLKSKNNMEITQDDLKAGIEGHVTSEDIDHVDNLMIEFANTHRNDYHVIIDSHHITKEKYGFVASMFNHEKLSRLNPTEIWVLYTTADITRSRIKENSEGRPLVTMFQADMHTYLQANLALYYGSVLGIQTYLFESDHELQQLTFSAVQRLNSR